VSWKKKKTEGRSIAKLNWTDLKVFVFFSLKILLAEEEEKEKTSALTPALALFLRRTICGLREQHTNHTSQLKALSLEAAFQFYSFYISIFLPFLLENIENSL
jgi:hypothetical protein